MHTAHCALCTVQCTLYIVQFAYSIVHFTMYIINCTVYTCFGDSCGEILRYNGIWDWGNPLGFIIHQPCGGSNGQRKKKSHIVGLSEMQGIYIVTCLPTLLLFHTKRMSRQIYSTSDGETDGEKRIFDILKLPRLIVNTYICLKKPET